MNVSRDKNLIIKIYIILYIIFILLNLKILNAKFLLSIRSVFFLCCMIILLKKIKGKFINNILLLSVLLAIGNIFYYFLLIISRTYKLSLSNFISNLLSLISYIYIAFNLFVSKIKGQGNILFLVIYWIVYIGIFVFDLVTNNVINIPLSIFENLISLALDLIIIWYSYNCAKNNALVN